MVQLQQRIEADTGVGVPLPWLMTGATLAQLVDHLAARVAGPPNGSTAAAAGRLAGVPRTARAGAESSRDWPLSRGQHWIWLNQMFEPGSAAYNISGAVRARGPLDGAALQAAVADLVSRHPLLRAGFPVISGTGPVLRIEPAVADPYREYDVADLDEAALVRRVAAAARQPFDCERAPLFRLARYRRPDGDVLQLTIHHIVTDFWSTTVLVRDLARCYAARAAGREPDLPPLPADFRDHVERQEEILADPERLARLTAYWDAQLADGAARLRLGPPHLPESAGGTTRWFTLPAALVEALRRRAAREAVTPYVLLLAAYQACLHGLTGQPRLVVGTSAAARGGPEFADVIGCFTNPVVILSETSPGQSLRELVLRTRDRVVGALDHQDYPMPLLAQRHRGEQLAGSLFDALFTFNRSPRPGEDLVPLAGFGPSGFAPAFGPVAVEPYPVPPEDGPVPVELVVAQTDSGYHGVLRCRGLAPEAADAVLAAFTDAVEAVTCDAGVRGPISRPEPHPAERG